MDFYLIHNSILEESSFEATHVVSTVAPLFTALERMCSLRCF